MPVLSESPDGGGYWCESETIYVLVHQIFMAYDSKREEAIKSSGEVGISFRGRVRKTNRKCDLRNHCGNDYLWYCSCGVM